MLSDQIDSLRLKLSTGYLNQFADATNKLVEPGYIYGSDIARLEALFRPFPLLAHSQLDSEKQFQVYVQHFNEEFQKIIDPNSKEYIGPIGDCDSRLNEAANLAFHSLIDERVWSHIASGNQEIFLSWISEAYTKDVTQNNWILFRGMLGVFLSEKGKIPLPKSAVNDFKRALTWMRPDGWFTDGENGAIDYYTGYVFYPYLIVACARGVMGNSDQQKILEGLVKWHAQLESMLDDKYRYPMFGRSLIYRFAFISPFLLSETLLGIQTSNHNNLSRLLAQFDFATITDDGLLTIGPLGSRVDLKENYSVRASTYWIARGLIPLHKYDKRKTSSSIEVPTTPNLETEFHKVIHGGNRNYLVNANRTLVTSQYFQHVIDSKNGWVKFTSFGKIQRLQRKGLKFGWKNVRVDEFDTCEMSDGKYLLWKVGRIGIYRVGWDDCILLENVLISRQSERTSSFHLFKNKFIYKESIFLASKRSSVLLKL